MKGKDLIKHLIILSVVLLSIPTLICAEKLTEFQEPFETVLLAMDDNKIYIADSRTCIVHIYSKISFEKIAQFGGKGQGPAEFEYIGFLKIFHDFIYVGSGIKISYFSKTGKFKKTITRLQKPGRYFPILNNYVGMSYPFVSPDAEKSKLRFDLFDSDFNEKAHIFSTEISKSNRYNPQSGKYDVSLIRGCHKFDVYNNKLFIGNTDIGFFFIVFDTQGKKLYEINLPYEKRKISLKERKQLIDRERKAWGEQRFNQIKAYQDYVFPKLYPAYSDYVVIDGKMYVFSYPIEGQPQEIIILDIKGNVLKKTTIPEVRPSYFISEGMYYYIKYNDEIYKWELHCERID